MRSGGANYRDESRLCHMLRVVRRIRQQMPARVMIFVKDTTRRRSSSTTFNFLAKMPTTFRKKSARTTPR